MNAHPLISVPDVPASSRFYQQVLGADSGHGGDEYEQVLVDGALVLQLHSLDIDHHHGPLGDPIGAARQRARAVVHDRRVRRAPSTGSAQSEAEIVTDVHVNPNSGCREIWLHDPDGYLVVLAEPFAPDGQRRESN